MINDFRVDAGLYGDVFRVLYPLFRYRFVVRGEYGQVGCLVFQIGLTIDQGYYRTRGRKKNVYLFMSSMRIMSYDERLVFYCFANALNDVRNAKDFYGDECEFVAVRRAGGFFYGF